jgi:uncharacterized protein YbjT (DUF2867 family)
MDVVIAGGHGQIALRLERLLSARGDRARALIRNPDHAADVEAAGAEAVVFDLEEGVADDLAAIVRGADAVVFAAGAGPGSGAERKRTVDLGAAVKLIDAARAAGVRRYAMVSSIGADDPASGGESMRPYLEAKAEADAALTTSGLDFTIVRPGALTNDPGTSKVTAGPDVGRAEIPRDDVAAVLVGVLDEPRTVGKTFVVVSGDTPIPSALAQL